MASITLTSRIKTKEGNYICLSKSNGYGRFFCGWFNNRMILTEIANAESWLWATTLGQELEFGKWDIELPFSANWNDAANLEFNEDDFLEKEDWIAAQKTEKDKKFGHLIFSEDAYIKRKKRAENKPFSLMPKCNIFGRKKSIFYKKTRKRVKNSGK